jgi:hypothetical protein
LAVCLPWYVAVCIRLPEFTGHFLWKHNILRFLNPFDHQEPIWFYVPIVFGGLFPASLLVIGWLRFLVSGEPQVAEQRHPALGFFLLAGAWCIVFFTLSGSKLVTYILPAFPALGLTVGSYVAAKPWRRSRWFRAVPAFVAISLAIIHYLALPWYAKFRSPMSQPETMARYCGDAATPVVCYPRNCDSVSFYLGRDDLRSYREKQVGDLLNFLQDQRRTVVLFTHRHSPAGLAYFLPARGLELKNLTPMSHSWVSSLATEDCLMGIVERATRAVGGAPEGGIEDTTVKRIRGAGTKERSRGSRSARPRNGET